MAEQDHSACRIPFFIAAPTTTLDPSLATGLEIVIEERDPQELTHSQGKRVAAEGIQVNVPSQSQFCG